MDKMEAIEFLQRDLIKYFDSRFDKSCSGVQFVNIIDEFFDNVKPLSSHAVLGEGWRDAMEELPNDRRDVIIGNVNNKCVSVGWWNSEHNNGEGKWLIRTVHFDGDVTHWRELPDPPDFT